MTLRVLLRSFKTILQAGELSTNYSYFMSNYRKIMIFHQKETSVSFLCLTKFYNWYKPRANQM